MVVSLPPWLLRAQLLRRAWSCMSWGGGEVRGRWGGYPREPCEHLLGTPCRAGGKEESG